MSALPELPSRVISPPPAIVDDATPMTPGHYIELRREARGLTIEEAAGRCGPPSHVTLVALRLRQAEADEVVLADEELEHLRRAIVFDPFIYQCLRDGVPAGRICTGCGCSWNDACSSRGSTCAWATDAPHVCTACQIKPRGDAVRLVVLDTPGNVTIVEALLPFARVADRIARRCPDGQLMDFRFKAGDLRAAARAFDQIGVR